MHQFTEFDDPRGWMADAKCRGQDMKKWDMDHAPQRGSKANQRHARKLCEGCPVFKQCAEMGIKTGSIGVVLAGRALTLSVNENRKILQDVLEAGTIGASVEPVRQLKPETVERWKDCRCKYCARPLRPEGITYHEWPISGSMQGASKTVCGSCHSKHRTRQGEVADRSKETREARQRARWSKRECRQCGVQLRPRGAVLSDWPGSVEIACDDQCKKCARKEVDTRTPDEKAAHRLELKRHVWQGRNCTYCETPLRPRSSDPEEWPGCVEVRVKNTCTKCHYQQSTVHLTPEERAEQLRQQRIELWRDRKCDMCNRSMRPDARDIVLSDFPDTVVARDSKRCGACHQKLKREANRNGRNVA